MLAEAMHVIGMYNAYMEPDGHLDLLQSVRFAVDVLPNEIEQEGDSQIFNFCICMIQKSIGQPFGDNAALFFSGDEFYESWGGWIEMVVSTLSWNIVNTK